MTTLTWIDGEPLTAGDIAYTFNWILDQKVGNFIDYLPYTDEITAPDDTTLIWKTTIPTGAPVYPPYVYIMPEHILSQYKTKADFKKWKGYPDAVGSGPFKLVEWRRGDFWRLEANKDYWGGAPKIDEFIFRVFQNEDAMIEALKQGEIDFADDISREPLRLDRRRAGHHDERREPHDLHPDELQPVHERDWRTARTRASTTTRRPQTPSSGRPSNTRSIERRWSTGSSLGTPQPGVTVIMQPKWHQDPSEVISYDPEEANRILDEAGYADTDGDGVRETPDGEPMELRFVVRTESPETVDAGEFIVEWMRDIGVSLKTEAVNDSKLGDIWYANDYDMYIWGWGVEPDPELPALHVHDQPMRRVERHVLLEPGVRPALPAAAEGGDRG